MTSFQVGVEGDLLTVKLDMAEVVKDLSYQVELCQEAVERTRRQWEESEWFLGEARATIARLEADAQVQGEAYAHLHAAHEQTTAQLHEAESQRDDATRAHEELVRQATSLTDQLNQAQASLETTRRLLEGSRVATIEGELHPAKSNGERRRASRAHRPDITVELQRHDGTVLFRGPLRDISRTGMGFASDRLGNGAPDLLWVTLHPDGGEHSIEAIARLAWLRQEDGSGSYAGGCELIDIPPGSRGAFEEVLGHSH